MSPGIVAEDGIDSQQAKQKDQPGAYFRGGQVVHAVVSIAEVEHLLQADTFKKALASCSLASTVSPRVRS